MHIRPLLHAETDLAAALHRAARRAAMPWLPDLHSPEEDRAFFHDHVFAQGPVLGAFSDSCLGFIACSPGWLDHLYIAPEAQGRGIGTALLDAARQQETQLDLWCFRRNTPALAFYAARGFRQIDATDGSTNEEREPDVLLRWQAPGPA